MTGCHVAVEAVPVPAGVGTHGTVVVDSLGLCVLFLLHTLRRLLWYLEARLPVLNGHFHEVQQVGGGGLDTITSAGCCLSELRLVEVRVLRLEVVGQFVLPLATVLTPVTVVPQDWLYTFH